VLDLLLLGQKTAPDFFWDARGGVLPRGATFTRGSSGWSFNSAGVLTQAGTDVARFDYDPNTRIALGYLAEMQSTNSVLQSQNFATGWTSSNIALTNNAATAPDGTATAATMLLSAGSALHQLQSSASFSYTSGSVYGVSMFVKEITGGSWIQFSFGGNSGYNFQPSTGTTGSALTGTQSSFVARQLANGWWRISFAFSAAATTSSVVAVNFVDSGNATPAPAITGDGTSKLAIWGFQFETANVGVTSYIPTAGSAVTRSADLLALPLSSLPGWNASKGGVLVATYRLHTIKTGGAEQNPVYIWDGGSNNIDLRAQSGTQAGAGAIGGLMRSTNGQINIGVTTSPVPTPFLRRRQAFGWGVTRGQLAMDGVLWGTQSGSFTMPVGMTAFHPGGNTGNSVNGTLESFAYYTGSRGDAFVQGLTQ
jgi:hypothetical protein